MENRDVVTCLLALRAVSLRSNGERVLSRVSLQAGAELVALLGSAGSGKTTLLQVAAGDRRPTEGQTARPESVWTVPEVPRATSLTPLKRLRRALHRRNGPTSEAGHLLEVYGLWDVRERDGRELGRSHTVAAAIAEGHAARPGLLLLDCCLDALSTHGCARAVGELYRLSRSSTCVLFATRRAEVAQLAPRVCILERGSLLADGSPQALVEGLDSEELIVETDDPLGVRSLVEPWQVEVRESPEGLRLSVPAGQHRAVELLRSGYGNIRAIISRPATLADAWDRLRMRV